MRNKIRGSLTVKKTPPLLSKSLMTSDQDLGVSRLFEQDETVLIADMGAGKTVVALTAIEELIAECVVDRVLVFAPLKVCQTVWQQERDKWVHLQELEIRLCTGTPAQRAEIIRTAPVGIVLLNFELMAWFFETYGVNHGFEGVLIDELSKMKGGGKGFKKMRDKLNSFEWRVGMTGTPVSEDFEGLFYQVMTVDAGKRFGKNKQKYLQKYFYQADFQGYDFKLLPDGAERIVEAISDLTHTLPDYRHELPAITSSIHKVTLPEEAMSRYRYLVKNGELDTQYGIQYCDNAAVLSGKLEQLASGMLYAVDDFGERIGKEFIHSAKMDALEYFLAAVAEPVIICYWYQHELERLRALRPDAVNLGEKDAVGRWNRGEIEVLLMQPMSASHGIELQFGGSLMIWLKPVWSNDLKSQADARLWRRGQSENVRIVEIVAAGTVDELIVDRVNGKKHFDTLFKTLNEKFRCRGQTT